MKCLTRSLVLALIIFSIPAGHSQTFDDFKKQIREEYNTFEKETQQKFNSFVAETDKEFSDYLSNNFGSYDIGHETFKPTRPKPSTIPVVDEVILSDNTIECDIAKTQAYYQGSVYPSIKKEESNDFDIRTIDVDFLGWQLVFKLDEAFFLLDMAKPSASAISDFWMQMSEVNYNHYLYQVSEVANTLNLNRWGYYQLLKESSKQVFPNSGNLQVLFQWTMLNRSRYKAKIGFNNKGLFLLLPSVYKMYNLDFVNIKGIDYYVIDVNGNNLETYMADFPEADIFMDLTIRKPFYTNPIKKSKDYKFEYEKHKYVVRLDFDEQMMLFYNTMPLSDVSVYFNSVITNRSKNSIKNAFGPILKGKSDIEKTNILLAFVQGAFDYKTDQQVFGRERYFFADEMLNYPYADCEDRSILFACLVKTLMGNEIVAVGFPGHIATAVDLGPAQKGTSLTYKNRKFTIADPTFMGAKAGMLMPSVSGEKAELFIIENKHLKSGLATKAWVETNLAGGFKADNQNDVVFDGEGNIYVCGYFMDEANFGDIKLTSDNQDREAFIVKYSSDLKALWAKPATGKGNDIALSMVMGNDNGIYVYGNFENNLNFGDLGINAVDAPDIFVAKYTKDGSFMWAKKAGIDKLDHSLGFIYAVRFNPKGEKTMAKLYSQSENFDHYGIELDDSENILVKGSFYATAGMNSNDFVNYNFEGDLGNIAEVLYTTDKKLKEKEYEQTIAGLFAALNLLKANTVEIQGANIKSTFDTYNKSFKDYASAFYDNLKEMKFLKNEKGIVVIKTSNEKPILLDKIKIDNNARIRIVKYKSGNILVEVLSGIYVGGGSHWLDMNSIKLFKESGDLLFDFDTDNSVKKMNLKKEILKH